MEACLVRTGTREKSAVQRDGLVRAGAVLVMMDVLQLQAIEN
jgi:hypothetical protein